jgi:hypothetical protein
MMVELDFNPQVGEQVQVAASAAPDDLYEIVDRHTSPSGELMLKLRRLRDGKLIDKISPILVDYPMDERIRRELKSTLSHCESLPEDFQERTYGVQWDEMYDGAPRIMVSFYLKPDVVPSLEKARVWNDFYAQLREKLQPLMDSGIWLQFAAKEDRSTQRAAS